MSREDFEVDLETLSGGEKDLASLCLRFAISKRISKLVGRSNMGFLALDEVFGSLDEDRREELLKALHEISKEFKQIFRNKAMLPIIFVLPIVQLIILVNAATFEIKKIDVALLDQDRSQTSNSLVDKLLSTGYYHMIEIVSSSKDAQLLMDQNKIDLLIHIPPKFEAGLQRDNKAAIMFDISAIDGSAASIIYYYTK